MKGDSYFRDLDQRPFHERPSRDLGCGYRDCSFRGTEAQVREHEKEAHEGEDPE